MSNVGGIFLGKPLPPKGSENPREVVRQYGLVWGRAVRDADDTTREERRVKFLVKYDEELNPNAGMPDKIRQTQKKYRPLCIECYVSGKRNMAAVMAAIELGDVVLCVGRVKSEIRNSKKRGRMVFRTMLVDLIIPAALIESLLRISSSDSIQAILDAEDAPDEWED